jgi:hypothetical protein
MKKGKRGKREGEILKGEEYDLDEYKRGSSGGIREGEERGSGL